MRKTFDQPASVRRKTAVAANWMSADTLTPALGEFVGKIIGEDEQQPQNPAGRHVARVMVVEIDTANTHQPGQDQCTEQGIPKSKPAGPAVAAAAQTKG